MQAQTTYLLHTHSPWTKNHLEYRQDLRQPCCSEDDDESAVTFTVDVKSTTTTPAASANKPTSLKQRMVELSNEFMKETETNISKWKDPIVEDIMNSERENSIESDRQTNVNAPGTEVKEQVHMRPSTIPPSSLLFRPLPPPGRPNLPPGPPPGLAPRLGMRLPPGPPPRMLRLPMMPPVPPVTAANMAGPQLITRNDGSQGATIMAKPQIRHLSADVTRFVPSALRVKREDKKSKNMTRQKLVNELKQQEILNRPTNGGAKDDAYMQFMREMEG